MYIDRDSITMAEVQQACAPYDEYAQCGACRWTGCVGDLQAHRQAKHPQSGVSMQIYRR